MPKISFPEEHPIDELLGSDILEAALAKILVDRAGLHSGVTVKYTYIALGDDTGVYDVTINGSLEDLTLVQHQLALDNDGSFDIMDDDVTSSN